MPTFTFTSPDGKKYDVSGPDGSTKEQAFAILQQRLSGNEAPKPGGLSALPPETSPGNQTPKNADSIAHRILGVGEAGLSAASSIPAGVAGQLYGIGKTLTGGKYGTQEGVQEGEKAGVDLANKLTYQPRTQTGQNVMAGLGNAMDASRLQGMPVEGPMLGRIGEVPRGVGMAAEGTAAARNAVGQELGSAGRTVGNAAARAMPAIDPETAQLARKAHGMGFRLTPDMVYGNKYGKIAGEFAQDNPLVGKNVREHNQQAINQNLASMIGGKGDKLTRKVFDDAMGKSGRAIGEVGAKYPLPVSAGFIGKLRANSANQLPEVAHVVDGYVDEIDRMSRREAPLPGGGRPSGRELPGEAFRRINTSIAKRMRETGNGDLKSALSNLQDDLMEERGQYMSEADKDVYNTARKQYAIGKTIEPLVAKSPTGDISPAALLGAVTATKSGRSAMARGAAGDLGTLADIGQRFLKEPKSSGTAERAFMQNVLKHPAGTAITGATAIATAPFAKAYNALGPRLTDKLIQRPPRITPQ